jgi:hypothetical protein
VGRRRRRQLLGVSITELPRMSRKAMFVYVNCLDYKGVLLRKDGLETDRAYVKRIGMVHEPRR